MGTHPFADPIESLRQFIPRPLQRILRFAGLDRAIAFTVMARLCQSLGSIVTVLLIVRMLSRVEQGYYYTLWSLVALQTVFELGFSFVVLQFAAHERAHLTIDDSGKITGDPTAHARLASVLQTIQKWYMVAAVLMVCFLIPLGNHVFAHRHDAGVHWRLPWYLTVCAAGFMFQVDPTFSFLEGCGYVPQIARVRLLQSLTGTAMAWTAMLTHHGLFAPAMVICGQALAGVGYLYTRRSLLVPLLKYKVGVHSVSWTKEILPFQWRIAVSWICNYIPNFLFAPVLFASRGSIEAGQFGMSLNITASVATIAISWMTTKAAPFGNLVSLGKFSELDNLFFHTLRRSAGLLSSCAVIAFAGLAGLYRFFPHFASRMVSLPTFFFLLLTIICTHIVQSEAFYLRAHKSEPFLKQSVIVACLLAGSTFVAVHLAGAFGLAVGYFCCSGLIALTSGTIIFQRKRHQWHKQLEITI